MNNQRDYMRYDPDDNALAIIHPGSDNTDQVIGLLRDESYKGWATLFQKNVFSFEEGDEVPVKAGPHTPCTAEIQWTTTVDDKFVKAGFERVEQGEENKI
ncbi:MAG: hypothetical protein ABEK50_01245 [bacterium]